MPHLFLLQCNAKYCELPVECKSCGLTLVSAPHLARSYHHLFPLPPFIEHLAKEFCRAGSIVGGRVRRQDRFKFQSPACKDWLIIVIIIIFKNARRTFLRFTTKNFCLERFFSVHFFGPDFFLFSSYGTDLYIRIDKKLDPARLPSL